MSFAAFEHSIESPSLKRVARCWQNARGARVLPNWGSLHLTKKLMLIVWSYRYDAETDKFNGRVAGVNIEQIFGKAFAGTPMEELYPPKDYPRLFARAKRVVGAPEFYRGAGVIFDHLDHWGHGERIMLPLATDGVHGDGILGATVYQFFLGERVAPVRNSDDWFPL